jgi:hypothetical protein
MELNASNNNITLNAHPARAEQQEKTAPPASWFCGMKFDFFGTKVTGVATGSNAQNKNTSQKFPVTSLSMFWSGERIKIASNLQLNHKKVPIFTGSQQDAQDLLKRITELKGKGTLVLKNIDDPKKGAELHYRDFWSKPDKATKTKTDLYIDSIINKAFSLPAAVKDKVQVDDNKGQESSTAGNKLQKSSKTLEGFLASYLSPQKATKDTTAQQNLYKLLSTHLETLKEAETKKIEELKKIENLESFAQAEGVEVVTPYFDDLFQSLSFNEDDEVSLKQQVAPPKEKFEGVAEKINSDINNYFQSKGVMVRQCIGKGQFGEVFKTIIDNEEFVYKKQEVDEFLTDDLELNGKIWRTGDIAASRCKDLSHFAKSIAFVLELTKPNGETERHFVATDKIKIFGQSLPENTKVKLVGQIMKKAPGTELAELLKGVNFNPVEHFNNIADALFSFLEPAYHRNLIHRDLKPENFMYDPTTKEGTVIDAGLGGVFGKQYKREHGEKTQKSSNLTVSKNRWGTIRYMAPAVWEGIQYGSEVDFHSTAMMLLEVIDEKDFTKVKVKSPNQILTRTDDYIKLLNENDNLVKTLKQYPDMQQTIDLFFNVASAAPAKRDDAFKALKNHMETVVGPKIRKPVPRNH